jgi:intein-encoded DNA endonuclease-like protein
MKKNNKWLAGFIDSEGCFYLNNKKTFAFSISQHKTDVLLMENIKKYLGGIGSIREDKERSTITYNITKEDDVINELLPKISQYLKSIKKEQLKECYKDQPEKYKNIILDNNQPMSDSWLAGFTDGDGSFHVNIGKDHRMKIGYQVKLNWSLTQHNKDINLLKQINNLFLDNKAFINKNKDCNILRIQNKNILKEYISPLYIKTPLKTRKNIDFLYWLQISELIFTNQHLTIEGLTKIKELRDLMNNNRINLKPRHITF